MKEAYTSEVLTLQTIYSRLVAIFRKGELLMDRFGFEAMMMHANTMMRVRDVFMYHKTTVREA